ncbi:MAG: ATP-grasp domain-containing protein, partial [Oscillospiraceae bacterium]|nr:ATP-grasp domain-containing protein [Oscillospiraceae bacterium]
MKVLMVGSGGREHALIRKLKESERVTQVICAPGNAGIAQDAACVAVDAMDLDGMLALAREEKPDLVFVAPDDPLVAGMADLMSANGFRTFGPSKDAARLEGSKVFSKGLMAKYGIPTAKYKVFDNVSDASAYIKNENSYPAVIKTDGLALGKGVVIAQNLEEAEDFLREVMENAKFGASGKRVVVEEYLTGPEVSVLAFTDGKTVRPMVSSMDHKRVFDG